MVPTEQELIRMLKASKSYHLFCAARDGEYGEEGRRAAAQVLAEQRRVQRLVGGLVLLACLVFSIWLIFSVMT